MMIALYSSRTEWGPTSALTVKDSDGKGGRFDRMRIHNEGGHVEITVRGKARIERGDDQTVIRLDDTVGDLIMRQR